MSQDDNHSQRISNIRISSPKGERDYRLKYYSEIVRQNPDVSQTFLNPPTYILNPKLYYLNPFG